MEGNYLDLFILEELLLNIEELLCVVLLRLRDLLIDVFVKVIENGRKILALAHLDNLGKVVDSLPEFAVPAAVRYGRYFEPHFISQLFHVLKQLLVEIEASIAAIAPFVHGE